METEVFALKPEVPLSRRFFFAGRRAVVFADVFAGSGTVIEEAGYEPPAGFAALLLHLAKNMIYCICNLILAI